MISNLVEKATKKRISADRTKDLLQFYNFTQKLPTLSQFLQNQLGLPSGETAALLRHWQKPRSLRRGDFLTRKGQVEQHLYYILEGTVIIFYDIEENEQVVGFGYADTLILSIPSFIRNRPSDYYIQAMGPTELLGISRTDFYRLLEQYPLLERTWRQGDWWASELTVRELFVEAYQVGLRHLPRLSEPDEATEALIAGLATEMYQAYADAVHWALYPDVRPTFDRLRAAGILLGVVSDWGHGLEALVLELGLADDLCFVVVSSRLGIAKPDPHVFELALSRIGVPAARALYVGDTYVKDVLGARAAGIEPVLLDRGGSAPPSDCAVIGDLRALLGLIGLEPQARPDATL